MDVKAAHHYLTEKSKANWGNFIYGYSSSHPLGVGLIFSGIRYPLLSIEEYIYDTVVGDVLVLTHECDIDQSNDRPFNDLALICPILPFEGVVDSLCKVLGDSGFKNFLDNLAKENISRVTYIPAIRETFLPYGGVINLNQITHTHVNSFRDSDAAGQAALTVYGLRSLDLKLTNHLLRPKSASLPLSRF